MISTGKIVIVAVTAALACDSGLSFVAPSTTSVERGSELHVEHISRRSFGASLVSSLGIASLSLSPKPAEASYSAYTAREKDWEQRNKSGQVSYSSARDLRAQLQEIAPMNSEGSMMFCPNGASAAVSPMMENKCGERLAAPSVYGRTSDSTGNSIPGFKSSSFSVSAKDVQGGKSISSDPTVGGFPTYK